jgi:ubiquinone/menaquinone biosynthesis C-methylase UbiE
MDDPVQARAYAAADFSEPNERFLELFAAAQGAHFAGTALDLGCGPGDIPLAFAQRYPTARLEVLDGAAAMLEIAREKLAAQPALAPRVTLRHALLPCGDLPERCYDAVLSNSLLHHLRDPLDLWHTVVRCARPGARILVMDLARPLTAAAVDRLVEAHAGDAPEVLRRDFRNSLFAAYTPREVAAQLRSAGLEGLEVGMVSDRHLAVQGTVA